MKEINVETIISSILSIIFHHDTRKENSESLRPLLSFSLYEKDTELYLKVTNIGKSGATGISVDICEMKNNGWNYIDEENMYNYDTFDLYPTESIEEMISTLQTDDLTEHPIICVEVSYIEQLTGKKQSYKREVICARS